MIAKNYKLFFVVYFIVLSPLLSCKAKEVGKDKQNKALEVSEWPFSVYNEKIRTERIKKVFQSNFFDVQSSKGTISQKQCKEILNQFLRNKSYKVLQPKVTSNYSDVSAFKGEFKNCPDLQFNRLWFSDIEGPLIANRNSEFEKLSISQRDEYSDYYFKFTDNYELYNFSKYFKKPVLGTFAEGGAIHCKDANHELCAKLTGYRRYGFSVGAVFNSNTCEMYLGPQLPVNPRLMVNTSSPFQYTETPSFFAFLEIDNRPYRFSFTSYDTLENFLSTHGQGKATVIIESLDSNGSGKCILETKE